MTDEPIERHQHPQTVDEVKEAILDGDFIATSAETYEKAVGELEDEGYSINVASQQKEELPPADNRSLQERVLSDGGARQIKVFFDPDDPTRFFNSGGGCMKITFVDDSEVIMKVANIMGNQIEGYIMRSNGEFERDPENSSYIHVAAVHTKDVMDVQSVHIANGRLCEGVTPEDMGQAGEVTGVGRAGGERKLKVVRSLDEG